MARFIDLEEVEGQQAQQPGVLAQRLARLEIATESLPENLRGRHLDATEKNKQCQQTAPVAPPPPPTNNVVTEAFQCYPVVFSIVSSIDLNTLDSLARTSRLIHNGLIQYRTSLLAATLRCSNEASPVDPDQTLRYRARAAVGNWHYMEDARSSSGKSGSCARDMVGECRRCAAVICRNCTIKPPAPAALRERHRRLCRTCARAPIPVLASPPLDAGLPLNSEAVQRAVCKCDSEGVWLCQPCGRTIRNADHEYKRIWRWRNHYGEVLGGLGTGIGDGDRGVICGREESCLAARDREHETDCDAEDAKGSSSSLAPWSSSSSPSTPSPASQQTTTTTTENAAAGFPFTTGPIEALIDDFRHHELRTPSPQQLGPGYERHEIEGIGGIVKRKLVRMVRVGACVPEWEDEKGPSSSRILAHEVSGMERSWCGWCWRAIPGKKDIKAGASSL